MGVLACRTRKTSMAESGMVRCSMVVIISRLTVWFTLIHVHECLRVLDGDVHRMRGGLELNSMEIWGFSFCFVMMFFLFIGFYLRQVKLHEICRECWRANWVKA